MTILSQIIKMIFLVQGSRSGYHQYQPRGTHQLPTEDWTCPPLRQGFKVSRSFVRFFAACFTSLTQEPFIRIAIFFMVEIACVNSCSRFGSFCVIIRIPNTYNNFMVDNFNYVTERKVDRPKGYSGQCIRPITTRTGVITVESRSVIHALALLVTLFSCLIFPTVPPSLAEDRALEQLLEVFQKKNVLTAEEVTMIRQTLDQENR